MERSLQETPQRKKKADTSRVVLKIFRILLHLLLNILFYAVVIFAISKCSVMAYDFAFQIFGNVSAEKAPGRDIEVTVTEKDSIKDVVKKLETKKAIINPYTFYIRARLSINDRRPIIPGNYKINTSQNYENILNTLTGVEQE